MGGLLSSQTILFGEGILPSSRLFLYFAAQFLTQALHFLPG
jgi:hypothetical protein